MGEGVTALILRSAYKARLGDLVTVNAGPSDVVILRGLVIDGLNRAANGIKFNTGAALHVQNSLVKNVRGASGVGINFTPGGASDLFVTDTTVINNNGVNGIGIQINPTGSGLVRATSNRLTVEQNGDGIKIDGSSSTGTSDPQCVIASCSPMAAAVCGRVHPAARSRRPSSSTRRSIRMRWSA